MVVVREYYYVILIILCSNDILCQGVPKPLTVLLRSNWGHTPPLLEASEFFWDYDQTLFWNFVNATKSLYSDSTTDKVAYELVAEEAERLLPPSVYNVLLFSLALHAYSPAVQLFYQVSEEAFNKFSKKPNDCNGSSVFVDVSGDLACTIGEVHDLIRLEEGNLSNIVSPPIDTFEHHFPSSVVDRGILVFLYGELGTPEFANMHSALSEMASGGKIQYIFRHYVKQTSSQRMLLSGFGVELSVKSTEYKAVDDSEVKGDGPQVVASKEEEEELRDVSGFIFSILKSRHPGLKPDLKDFEAHLLQGAREMPELKLWQLQDLGFQAAQRVVAAGQEYGLTMLKEISQNLPMQAKMLYKIQVDKALRKEIEANQKVLSTIGVMPGSCVLLLNGIIIQSDHMDIYQLLELLLSESRMLDRLSALGIRSDAYSSLLAMSVHSPESKEVVIDVRGKEVVFLNDLEKDRVYRSWAKSLTEFLRPTYPGMLRQIARNVFNIVFMLDPLSPSGHELLEYVKLFLDHLIPARFGLLLVPDPQDEVGIAVCQGFSFIAAKISPREGLRWIIKTQELSSTLHVNVTVDDISKLFLKLFSKALGKLSVGDVFSDEWDLYRKEASAFFSAKGFTSLPQVLVNGVQLDLEEDLETSIVTRLHHQTYEVQQALFTHRLKDKDDVYNFFLNKQNVLTRFNSHVLAKSKVFDLSYNEHSEGQLTGSVSKSLHYVYRAESEFTIKELTVWMAVNLSTSQGRKLVLDAIHYSESSELVRVGIVHNSGESISLVARAVQAILLSHLPVSSVIVFLEALLTLPDPVEMTQIISMAPSHGISPDKIRKLLFSDEVNSSIANHAIFCSTVLRLKDRENAMLSNGKLIGPFSEREVFSHADWSMLERMESDSYASNLATTVGSLAIKNLSPDDDTASYRSDLVMKLASLLRNQPRRNRLSQLPTLSSQYSALHLTPLDSELPLFMVAILDPLSPDTQQFSAILQSLRVALSLDLTLYLNPVAKLSQMPITSFYRYVLEPELSFGEDGALQDNVVAIFSDLPTSPLFTLSLDVPHSWLVEPVFSPYDLDNIHLAQVGDGSIHAEFTLEHILVEGQCFDVHSDQPTPGLEYVLGSSSHPDLFDTVVMANLGYFQLKAGPGAWFLRLREGRSMDIYSIHSYSGGDHSGSMEELLDNKVSINVRSFRGFGVVLKVSKRPGMEEASLLTDEMSEEKSTSDDDSGDSNNLWNTFSRFLHTPGADGGKETTVTTNETINIFSIASGHLYERFLRIMMLSVLKHTKNPVKFWFLKNYLSPTFKEFIPYMAVHYGFEFELVEYKWPRWLHAQTQKQRIIWGYKILFLDVLFPLSVKKIVFVDADQIIRTDLKELLEIPLDGAPYAYTPFCNSRSDMEGFRDVGMVKSSMAAASPCVLIIEFQLSSIMANSLTLRFWEKGYWKSHLGNRRYHISALYVVDLVSFRQLAAGDRLRGQYQALSQDPNSLSNLDQDLPNNMIHSVPIKSLPQEWLWCETWCSQESKAQAKTIDLCNNPLTKEPKLQSAMRIVPEWTDYDNEIKSLWEKFADNHTHHAPKTHDHIEL